MPKLTATLIKKLEPKSGRYRVQDDQLKGFFVRVYSSGVKSYFVEWGRGKEMKLGRVGVLTPYQARELALEKLAEAAKGIDPRTKRREAKEPTLDEYLKESYHPWVLSHLKTGERQTNRIRSCFPDLLKTKLSKLTPWHIEKYRTRRLKAGVSTRTVNRDVQALRAALRRAWDWGIIGEHPLQKVKALREDKSARVRYLSAEEESRLREALDARQEKARKDRDSANEWRRERGYKLLSDLREAAFTDHLKPLVILAMNTGLRRGEMFNLHWRDVDLTGGTVTVEGIGAKSHQTRHVPLNREALETLTAWREKAAVEVYVFPSADGGRLDNVKTSWTHLVKAAKLKEFRFHDLRHHFASRLVMNGVDLNTVRELLGHSDLKMTLRYAHLSPEKKREAVERLVVSHG